MMKRMKSFINIIIMSELLLIRIEDYSFQSSTMQIGNQFLKYHKKLINWQKRSEEHTSELQSRFDLVCRLLLEKKKDRQKPTMPQPDQQAHSARHHKAAESARGSNTHR